MVEALIISNPNQEINQIINLDENYFPYPWSESSWKSLEWSRYQLFGLYQVKELIGFSLFYMVPEDQLAHLLKIIIKPDFRGQNDSQKLWQISEDHFNSQAITRIILEVAEDNPTAIKFYEKLGFTSLNLIKGYYSDGKAAICYEKKMQRAG